MKTLLRFAAIAAVATVTVMTPSSASAQSGHTAVGAERRAILDALRPPIQRQAGPNVEFVVHEARVHNGWAFVNASPQRRGGGRIDPRLLGGSRDSGHDVQAIMRRENGRWRIVRHVIGAGDVWYCGIGPRGLVPRCDGTY